MLEEKALIAELGESQHWSLAFIAYVYVAIYATVLLSFKFQDFVSKLF